MRASKKKAKDKDVKYLFSGDNSSEMWGYINAVTDENIRWALYIMGCKCQELESLVRKLKNNDEY